MAPSLGFGLGLRPPHYKSVLATRPAVDWFEIVTENYMGAGGKPRHYLDGIRRRYPVVLHGVGLSIGSTGSLSKRYLADLKELADRIQPPFITDHLCWTSHRGRNAHDLLPLAYTQATLDHVVERVHQVQEALGRRLYLENPSAYVAFAANEMGEAEFLAALCRRAGSGILLDVNNLYVNAMNLGIDATEYLATLDPSWLCYFHLAGHTVQPDIRIDTHDEPVSTEVWALYREAVRRFPGVATLVEWDGRLPEFSRLHAELTRARAMHEAALLGDEPSTTVAAPWEARNPHGATTKGQTASVAWGELQDAFFQAATGQESLVEAARELELLVHGLPARALVGMNVYVEAYHLRLCEIARATYPALYQVLGDRPFNELVGAYLHVYPPCAASVKYAVAEIATYLMSDASAIDLGGLPMRVLADLAALEWATEDLFDAPDSPSPVGLSVLAEIQPDDWETLRFELIAALRVVATQYPVGEVIQAVKDGQAPARPTATPTWYLVARPDLTVEYEEITQLEALALTAVLRGATLPEAAAEIAAATTDGSAESLPALLVEYVAHWIRLGLVHGVADRLHCS